MTPPHSDPEPSSEPSDDDFVLPAAHAATPGEVADPQATNQEPLEPEDPGSADADVAAGANGATIESDVTEAEKPARPFWRELPILILIALVVAVIIKTFLVQAFYIPSASMEDTLQINDRVMVNKLAYTFSDIQRGHVIVFDDPSRSDSGSTESVPARIVRNLAESVGVSTPQSEFIKRVIGLPGDTVRVRRNTVFVNGEPLDEPYVAPGTNMPRFEEVTVPSGHVFVMGDNRDVSQDSRVFGPVPVEDIVGRAFVLIWPPSRWTML